MVCHSQTWKSTSAGCPTALYNVLMPPLRFGKQCRKAKESRERGVVQPDGDGGLPSGLRAEMCRLRSRRFSFEGSADVDDGGTASFEGLPSGVYVLVVTDGSSERTAVLVAEERSIEDGSLVDISTEDGAAMEARHEFIELDLHLISEFPGVG